MDHHRHYIYYICIRCSPKTACLVWLMALSLQWCHNERNGISNYQSLDCLLSHLFRRRPKKTSKLRITGLCEGNPPVTSGFPYKGPVTWIVSPFEDVIICREQPVWWFCRIVVLVVVLNMVSSSQYRNVILANQNITLLIAVRCHRKSP